MSRLKALWEGNATEERQPPTIEEELASARESALLHAKALDEAKRTFKRAESRLLRQIARQEEVIDWLLDRRAMNGGNA